MKSGRPTKSAAPGRILLQTAGAQQTGALVVDANPGGILHLVDGLVTYAESPAAPGVGELLTASGRLAARTWQSALDAGSADGRVGRLLVEHGHLTQGELELCVLGAIYDAAYFVLRPGSAPIEFLTGQQHWLGPVVRVDAAAVARESRRRGRLLDEIFPHPQLDTAPVTPVPRPPVERVALTASQWELLVHADGQRTPADLAQLLGRAGYATVQELRRLAERGLLELPRPRDPKESNPNFVRIPPGYGPSVDIRRPVVLVPPSAPAPAVGGTAGANGSRSAPASGDPPQHAANTAGPVNAAGPATVTGRANVTSLANGVGAATGSGSGPEPLPRLPRRKPNAKLPKGVLTDDNAPIHTGTDEALLKRIRTALRALR